MNRKVTLIPGDGIGPDITEATLRVLDAAGARIDWDRRQAGVAAISEFQSPLPEETLESVREATPDDVGGLLALLRPLEQDGTLVKRDRALIEREIGNFTVIEHDGVIFGCAALYAFPESRMGEMACLAVNPSVQNRGDGERLLRRIEQRARAAGLKKLFVLTTRTMHWFLKRGFVVAPVDVLPAERKNLYNLQRRSLVLIKNL